MQSSRWATKPTESPKPASSPAAPSSKPSSSAQVKAEAQPAPPPPEPPAEAAPPPAGETSYGYSYQDPSLDSFAQTAGTDDLFFDDDFTPIAEPVVEPTPVETQTPQAVETSPPLELAQSQHAPRGPANNERGSRGRGRGRGGRGGRGGHDQNRGGHEQAPRRSQYTDIRKEEEQNQQNQQAASSTPETSTGEDTAQAETGATDVPSTPSGPKEPKPPTSVRGDRTLTGGPQRKKLTEEELSAKLATMRSKNETLAAAHARAEADLANFEAREAVAAKQSAEKKKQAVERQKQDRQNRQQMMGERERNRQRKLNAQGGREWDVEKEDGFAGTGEERRRGAARGAHGGIAPSPRPAASTPDEFNIAQEDDGIPSSHNARGRGRSRGPRGARGGGGRGGRDNNSNPTQTSKNPSAQHPPTASDFPELPSTASASTPKENPDSSAPKKLDFPIKTKTTDIKDADPDRPGIKKQESFGLGSPLGPGKSWADQVEGA